VKAAGDAIRVPAGSSHSSLEPHSVSFAKKIAMSDRMSRRLPRIAGLPFARLQRDEGIFDRSIVQPKVGPGRSPEDQMADETAQLKAPSGIIDFERSPDTDRHWKLIVAGETAGLIMDVDEAATLFEGYELKLNSYDLGVDIELADALQRLRFEHPGVKVVILRSGKDRVFCAGANIRMLAGATHARTK
jgi:hypothetical protein